VRQEGERDFEIDAFLVDSYVFCMSVDWADRATASDTRNWKGKL